MSGTRARTGSALAILALGFAGSALLRAGEVVAALPELAEDGFGRAVPAAQSEGAESAAPDPLGLLAELRQRQQALRERERRLDDRAATLEAVEARLRARLDELDRAQQRLEETAALVDDAAGKDVRHLAALYQTMKPKQAAAIFDQMAPSFAAGFIAQMAPEAAAQVMANMAADKAYAVSLLLASRNVGRGPVE